MISSYCINNSKVYFVVLCKFSGSVPEAIPPHLLSCYQNHATYSWSPSNFKLVWCILNEIRDLVEIGNFLGLVQGKSRFWTISRDFFYWHMRSTAFFTGNSKIMFFLASSESLLSYCLIAYLDLQTGRELSLCGDLWGFGSIS